VIDSAVPEVLRDLLADRPWLVALVVGAVVLLLRLLRRAGAPVAHPGEVWFAMVPFRDGTGAKDRPVVVLSRHGRRVTVARLTSRDQSARTRDYARAPLPLPGLHGTSWVDLRPLELPRSALRRRTGDAGDDWLLWFDNIAHERDAR